MNFLWDTSILLHYVRKSEKFQDADRAIAFFDNGNRVFLSVINIGEIESLAYQLSWGQVKRDELQKLLEKTTLLGIYEEVIHAYARIDAFSQGKLSGLPLPSGVTARNMGKNDIWLAATAHVGKFRFATTDNDFDHLDRAFIDLLKI